MMETIRAAANHVAVKIIFAIIIISFIFTGVGYFGFGGNSVRDEQLYVAKVDGEGISRAQFEAIAKQQTSRAMGDSAFINQIRQEVLSGLIDNYLAYKLAKDLNIHVSDAKIKETISKEKVFFENGKFNNQKYLNTLAANGYTPDSYAENLRTLLQQQQLMNTLVYSEFSLPVDSEVSLLENQTRKVYVSPINSSIINMDDVKISTEEEQKYYDENKNLFFKKERVKFKYIVNAKQDYLNEAEITDDLVKQEYNSHIKDYTFPAKKSFSVIFVTNQNQAEDIIKDLSTGAEFATVIKNIDQNKDNESPYGKNGSLGWFADDDSLPQEFKDANLQKVGEISKPIAVNGGYLIVKLDDLQEAKNMDFDYAKFDIKSKLMNERVNHAFENKENKIISALSNQPNDLDAIAKEAGLIVKESDWTYYNDPNSILRYPELKDVAFGNEMIEEGKATNKVSDMIPVGRDMGMSDFVIQVIDYKPEGIATFDEVKDEIHSKLYNNILEERFNSKVDGIVKELNEKGNSPNIQFTQNYTLNRNSTELDKKVVDMVFNLVPSVTNKRVYGVEYINSKNAYIAVLTDVINSQEQTDISSSLLPMLFQNTYFSLTDDIRSQAKIEIMPN